MTSLSPEDVCRVLNEWSAGGWFRIHALGGRISISEIKPRGCHTVRLTSQYEAREAAQVHVPYDGGRVDNVVPETGPCPERLLRASHREESADTRLLTALLIGSVLVGAGLAALVYWLVFN
jgi:hypothetical protein